MKLPLPVLKESSVKIVPVETNAESDLNNGVSEDRLQVYETSFEIVHDQLDDQHRLNRPNIIPINVFDPTGIVPGQCSRLIICGRMSGRVSGHVVTCQWVELEEHEDGGYETDCIIGEIANIESLRPTGLLDFAEQVGKIYKILLMAHLTNRDMATEEKTRVIKYTRELLFDVAGLSDDTVRAFFPQLLGHQWQRVGWARIMNYERFLDRPVSQTK